MTHTLKQGEKGIDLPLKTPSICKLINQMSAITDRKVNLGILIKSTTYTKGPTN